MKNSGLAIHCHHDNLVEFCYDYKGRGDYIKVEKPPQEQEIRLRLFKLLSKEAIEDLPKALFKANAERAKAYAERAKANAEWDKAYAERAKAYAERAKAHTEWVKANTEWAKTDTATAWHKKWCGCSYWNGREIVFNKNEVVLEKKQRKE